MADTIVVTAATGPLGRRVCELATADPTVGRVIALDRPGAPVPPSATPPPAGTVVEHHRLALGDPEVKRLCEGAAVIVHLGASAPGSGRDPVALDGVGVADAADVESTRVLLAVAADVAVPRLVILSTAMVYGAWPGGPVPLTEAAPLRPVPALDYAVERAEIERLAANWRDGPDRRVALLRPVVTVDPDDPRWLGRSPWSMAGLTVSEGPPAQFVHIDDVASAVDLARRVRLDGPFNVAPDGWLSVDDRRNLAGPLPRLPLPAPVAERLASFRWRFGLTGVPPGVLPYTMYAWVVANDRLRAAGWMPAHTNEEAFVEAGPGSPLAVVHPRRRQVLSLAVLGAPALLAGVVAAVAARRVLRARRRR
jgi:nucleoside-diphosphate-sugar epimerase